MQIAKIYPACERLIALGHPRGQKKTNAAKEDMASFDYLHERSLPINISSSSLRERLGGMENHTNLSRAASPRQSGFGGLIGESPPMRRLYDLIARASQCTTPVLVTGETGAGKELVARAIHFKGLGCQRAFMPVGCSALTPTLVESELFGHVRGAFTGAEHSRRGLFEEAHEGTIFLDEIGKLATHLQAKLLRVLQEREVRPVGSAGRIPVDARVTAATNRDLEAGARAGTFRQDLFFRLKAIQIRLPALRERKVDIPLLVGYFLRKFSDPLRPARSIADAALRQRMAYDWPGNVRELEHTTESGVALSSGTVLQADDLVSCLGVAFRLPPDGNALVPRAVVERRAILRALREIEGDTLAAARLPRIGKTTLYRKLKQYRCTPSGAYGKGLPVANGQDLTSTSDESTLGRKPRRDYRWRPEQL